MSVKSSDLSSDETLVFGANGFLGSAITNNLSVSGRKVIAIIRPDASLNHLSENPNLRIIRISPKLWPKLLEDLKPTHIICAQWRGVQRNLRGDIHLQESNLKFIVELAEVAKSLSTSTFIALGSQAESTESMSPIMEAHSTSGTSPYGSTKSRLCSELLSLFEDSNTRFIWARVFSVYGPSDKSDSILMQLHNSDLQNTALTIENPKALWSFLYEDDFADAVKRILECTEISGVINIANPQLVEIQQIVDTWFGSSRNTSDWYEKDIIREGFFPIVGKLKSIGWTPEVSLEKGIQWTREAYRKRLN